MSEMIGSQLSDSFTTGNEVQIKTLSNQIFTPMA